MEYRMIDHGLKSENFHPDVTDQEMHDFHNSAHGQGITPQEAITNAIQNLFENEMEALKALCTTIEGNECTTDERGESIAPEAKEYHVTILFRLT